MNILISNSWLQDHLKTKATPKQIAKALTLCSQSVEKIIKHKNDWVYDIEVTTNRPDCLSVYGLARELAAILPRFNLKAQLKPLIETKIDFPQIKKSLPLKIDIKDPTLCPRFTALIFDQVTIGPSPKIIQNHLIQSEIRALNNVVDISNYLMLELGQPMHTFDYDKILKNKMILRESKKGETIITLDNQSRNLPEKTIVIEDGQGRLIDLCGIMGGANSEVDQKTKRVLLFVQTYDPVRIRQSCQKMAFRTEAAARFEKGIEPMGVIPAMKKAMVMFEKNCHARVSSNLIDIFPHPPKPISVNLSQEKLNQMMGIKIKLSEANQILNSLGFVSKVASQSSTITATVPYWRSGDVSLPQDLVEEVARVYGYHNLPNVLPAGAIPLENSLKTNFAWEEKAKDLLKGFGLTETVTNSIISQKDIENIGYQPKNYLEVNNPLNQDWQYMRPCLIPSLLQSISNNSPSTNLIKIFEMAHIYLPRGSQKLPEERMVLTMAQSNGDFSQAKGIVEALLPELSIDGFRFEAYALGNKTNSKLWLASKTAIIKRKNRRLGVIGEIRQKVLEGFGIDHQVVMTDLDFEELVKLITKTKIFQAISKYPAILQDLTFITKPQTPVEEMSLLIKSCHPLIRQVKLLDTFKNSQTFRILFQSHRKNLTDQEVEKIRNNIIQVVKKKFKASFKQKAS
ncbi:phenylalanine--tRNA ligase subunit beta [Patescibacteria group bacterium]